MENRIFFFRHTHTVVWCSSKSPGSECSTQQEQNKASQRSVSNVQQFSYQWKIISRRNCSLQWSQRLAPMHSNCVLSWSIGFALDKGSCTVRQKFLRTWNFTIFVVGLVLPKYHSWNNLCYTEHVCRPCNSVAMCSIRENLIHKLRCNGLIREYFWLWKFLSYSILHPTQKLLSLVNEYAHFKNAYFIENLLWPWHSESVPE